MDSAIYNDVSDTFCCVYAIPIYYDINVYMFMADNTFENDFCLKTLYDV